MCTTFCTEAGAVEIAARIDALAGGKVQAKVAITASEIVCALLASTIGQHLLRALPEAGAAEIAARIAGPANFDIHQIVIIFFAICAEAGAAEIAARIHGPAGGRVQAKVAIAAIDIGCATFDIHQIVIISSALCTEARATEIAARSTAILEAGSKQR